MGIAFFWLSILSFAAACVASIAARSLHSFPRRELEEICESRQTPDRFAAIIHGHERVALGVEMLVMVLVGLATSSAMFWVWRSFEIVAARPALTMLLAAIVVGQIAALTIVWLPWSITRIGSARFLYAT